MELGINQTVDDISAEHLDRLRKEIATSGIPEAFIESMMIRIAPHMHAAVTEAYDVSAAVTSGVVPEMD